MGKIEDVSKGDKVTLLFPDGWKMRGTYQGYVPAAGRYSFGIKILTEKETTVLFLPKTMGEVDIQKVA